MKRIRLGSLSKTATSWSKLRRSVKNEPILPAPKINIFIVAGLLLFLVHDNHLLTDRFLMDALQDLLHEVRVQIHL